MSGQVQLPARMDTANAVALDARLGGADALTIDAGGVDMIGGLCLEILADAVARRHAAGAAVTFQGPSDAFRAALATLGIDPETLQTGGISQ